jgi:RNA polymerase-binding transcription factor DksA
MATRKSRRVRRKPRATTAEVVGDTRQALRFPRKWRAHRSRLLALRQHLLNTRSELSRDANEEQPAFSSHMADAATDSYDRDLALGMLSSEQDAIFEIDQALDRIYKGDYGRCELTGKPIERARLEAIPWTRFCAEAERQLEKQSALVSSRLGPRETVAEPRRGVPGAPGAGGSAH